jgi:YteA family regulatory protein
MNKDQLAKIKQQLQDEKRHLQRVVDDIDEGGLAVPLSDSIEELSTYDQHPADVASEVFERSKDFALREDAMIKLRAIDHALQRIREGTYGVCENCGREIPPERLEAIPYTTQCVHCRAAAEEASNRVNVRPVEEDLLEPPFAKSFDDATGKNMYDAEDSWQDVATWQEHAPHSGAGSYYGGGEADEEPIGYTELVDHIPYEVGDDGIIYESTRGMDDEKAPAERIDVGLEHEAGR